MFITIYRRRCPSRERLLRRRRTAHFELTFVGRRDIWFVGYFQYDDITIIRSRQQTPSSCRCDKYYIIKTLLSRRPPYDLYNNIIVFIVIVVAPDTWRRGDNDDGM